MQELQGKREEQIDEMGKECRPETFEPCHAERKSVEAGMASRREAQNKLDIFSERWRDYSGTEITGSQTFLNEFFECFDIRFSPNNLPYEHRDEEIHRIAEQKESRRPEDRNILSD